MSTNEQDTNNGAREEAARPHAKDVPYTAAMEDRYRAARKRVLGKGPDVNARTQQESEFGAASLDAELSNYLYRRSRR